MNGQYPKKNVLGQLAIVLHAHLPYVRKNEKYSLEEDWLFQAILECYIPLLQSIESSKNENPLNTKLTISLSPTLLSLQNNKKIQETFPSWIETRNDFLNELPQEEKNASAFLMNNLNDKYLYWQKCSGNLIEKYRVLNNSGNLDILTCAATHGYLPILRENPETVLGQINTAIRSHEVIFGSRPLGIWLPECAYYENLDEILFNSGIRYAILDGHGILNATPRPRYGVYAPICSKKGVAFFGRDSESTLPVWSAKDGFPGDKVYREFHKDLGWELPISKLQKKGISTKRPLGLKFHKITDDKVPLGEKAFYLENEAKKKVEEHADSYLLARSKQLEPDEYSPGTFTLSNLGMFGVDRFDAILPPGTGAILAIASSKPTVAANSDGSISVKKIMQVNLTADHRVIYGADGASFLKDLANLIENEPETLVS